MRGRGRTRRSVGRGVRGESRTSSDKRLETLVSSDVITEPKAHPADAPTMIPPSIAPPETRMYRMKNRLLGRPLATEQLAHERLGKPTALAVFASDNLSSSAYATEEILRVLVPAVGVAALAMVLPITVAMLVVLGFLILSYRQTIKAYPSAGEIGRASCRERV